MRIERRPAAESTYRARDVGPVQGLRYQTACARASNKDQHKVPSQDATTSVLRVQPDADGANFRRADCPALYVLATDEWDAVDDLGAGLQHAVGSRSRQQVI